MKPDAIEPSRPARDDSRLAAWLLAPLRGRMETLLRPPGAPADEFDTPASEPALVAADSVSWQVFRNPVALFVGGVAAVLLELAEPRVRTGVWEHTTFRTDPLPRMRRTAHATMMTVYGPRSRAEALIAAVNRRHATIEGHTPAGIPFRALDDELLAWVHVTAHVGFLEAFTRLVRPLPAAARDAFFAERVVVGRLFGVATPPACEADVERLFEQMRPRLEPSPVIAEFLAIVERMPALPWIARPLQRWLVRAAVDCLPAWTRERLGVAGPRWRLAGWRRRVVTLLARGADRLPLPGHPVIAASRRLGLGGGAPRHAADAR
ncbi:MAG: oxygenase MpaB family protein [Burkholderiaceae bacterium]